MKWFLKKFRLMTKLMTSFILVSQLAILGVPLPAVALPQGGQVVNGDVAMNEDGSSLTITQSTGKAIVNWSSFSIGSAELVQFLQPGASSAALNRVTGAESSAILGQLLANGQVFLINPNGVLFGSTATVNVGSLLVSTLNIADNDFLSGTYQFQQDPGKALSYIINKGELRVADGGYVVLAAPLVSNEGVIVANLGKVRIAGTDELTLDLSGDGMIKICVGQVLNPGTVEMGADVATDLIKAVVNCESLVSAGQVVEENGIVKLVAAEGTVINSGTISVNGASGQNAGSIVLNSTQATAIIPSSVLEAKGIGEGSNGGFIETSTMGNFLIKGMIDASAENGTGGTWLLDPTNVTISAAASDYGTQPAGGPIYDDGGIDNHEWIADTNNILNTEIVAFLDAGTSVTIDTTSAHGGAGNITVTAVIGKTAGGAAVLTFDADGNILISSAISSTNGTLGVSLTALGNVTIGAPITTLGGTFSSIGVDFDNTGGTITTAGGGITVNHTGNVTFGAALSSDAGNVDIDAVGTLAINQAINTTTGTVAIDSTGVTTVAAAGDIITTGGVATVAFGAAKAGTLTTSGDVTTNGAGITFTNAVTLGGNVALVSAGGAIAFDSTLNGTTAGVETLGITAGAGDVTLTGAV
ncbi:MAG: filamentous hemagglutinin N-terminal domain-containing protein, partial [Candidatus Omnitrophota bacterium]